MEIKCFSDNRVLMSNNSKSNSFQISKGGGSQDSKQSLEIKFEVPHFESPYGNRPRHPLADQFIDEAHTFMVFHGVDKQLGLDLWSALIRAKTTELMAFVYSDIDVRDFLWMSKLVSVVYAIDTKMDESDYMDNPDKSSATVLGVTLSLLWYNPTDERLVEHLKPLFDSLTTVESRALVKTFYEDLLHARNETKNLMEVEMTPMASAFRELWIEYCEAVPGELLMRQAYSIHNYLMGCIWEANNRRAGYQIDNLEEYTCIRRLTSAVDIFIICSDMFISRMQVPHIPNSLFYGSEMQRLVISINDVIGWHNDIFSAYKEVIIGEDGHNLVRVLYEELNCTSYTEAGRIALQLVQNRIADMERAYEQLKVVAPSACQPAIERYITTCRNWISGTHQFHIISPRYDVAEN